MAVEIHAFAVTILGAEAPEAADPAAGVGVARLLEHKLGQAGVPLAAAGSEMRGSVWISDRWQAELEVGGERHAEEAPFTMGHHLLYRLAEFTAQRRGGALPEPVTRGFEDVRTPSPGAMLAYWTGWGLDTPARLRAWQRAFEMDPAMVGARAGIAEILLQRNQREAAADLLRGVGIQDGETARELGLALWSQAGTADQTRSHAVALELLQAAVQSNDTDAIAAAALAALLARAVGAPEALDEALLLASRSTELAADDYRTWAALADVYRARKDHAQAGFYYGFALRLAPEAPTVLQDAAANWLQAGEPRRALALIERSLQQQADAAGYGNLALAHDLMGATEAALQAARQATERNSADARFWILRGDLAQKAGKLEEAQRAWTQARTLDPLRAIDTAGSNIARPGSR